MGVFLGRSSSEEECSSGYECDEQDSSDDKEDKRLLVFFLFFVRFRRGGHGDGFCIGEDADYWRSDGFVCVAASLWDIRKIQADCFLGAGIAESPQGKGLFFGICGGMFPSIGYRQVGFRRLFLTNEADGLRHGVFFGRDSGLSFSRSQFCRFGKGLSAEGAEPCTVLYRLSTMIAEHAFSFPEYSTACNYSQCPAGFAVGAHCIFVRFGVFRHAGRYRLAFGTISGGLQVCGNARRDDGREVDSGAS